MLSSEGGSGCPEPDIASDPAAPGPAFVQGRGWSRQLTFGGSPETFEPDIPPGLIGPEADPCCRVTLRDGCGDGEGRSHLAACFSDDGKLRVGVLGLSGIQPPIAHVTPILLSQSRGALHSSLSSRLVAQPIYRTSSRAASGERIDLIEWRV